LFVRLATVVVCVLGCATRGRSSCAAPTAGNQATVVTADAGPRRAVDAQPKRVEPGMASLPDGGVKPVGPISSPCVLHAAQGKRQTREVRLPGGAAGPEEQHGSCSADAECIATNGQETPGDGFVYLTCNERTCTCLLEPLRSSRSRHITITFTFALSAPCATSGLALDLIVERCMPGMTVLSHDPTPQRSGAEGPTYRN
jgi:hypothetical protein